jgi:hypothetical protein
MCTSLIVIMKSMYLTLSKPISCMFRMDVTRQRLAVIHIIRHSAMIHPRTSPRFHPGIPDVGAKNGKNGTV